jgi:membrane-bound lytic murein transglycosylase B
VTGTRLAVVVASWVAVLGVAAGLTAGVLALRHDPDPILEYDAARLAAPVPTGAPAAGVPRPSESARGAPVVDPGWVQETAASTGLAAPAVRAYATASVRLAAEQPGCRLGWSTLAGIGEVESGHGTFGGRTLLADGRPSAPIVGPALDGRGPVAAIRATGSATALHGDVTWDHAVGPLQFLPSTWARWGGDGDGDGIADPQDLDDAAYAAGRYLCAGGGDLSQGESWQQAVLSYNHSASYVAAVYAAALRVTGG